MSVERLLTSFTPGGGDFERLCKWLLENAPEYRPKLRRVWRWDEWPGRWGADAGIDLVAEAEDGLWAVQAKHYNPAYAIRKADIDSFLSESARPGFSYRLLIASTDHVGPTARRTLAAQEKPVGMLLRSQLLGLEVEWPTSLARLRPARPKRKKPRPHQQLAIRDCEKGLLAQDRGQLVMACGTGKTLVGPFLAERLASRRVLVLVPSLSLLGQTLREWATAIDFDYLAICSDETVTKAEQDAVVASTSELGIPVTTDPERIRRFLRRRGNAMKVVLATYQSSPQVASAQAGRVPTFDLVIADEAHRCAGPQAGVFATVIDAKKIKARRRLFMTATPRYFTGRVKREAKEADWEVASMDDEEKFGKVLHRLTFAQAIDQDLLSEYQVAVVGVTDQNYREMAERGAFVTRDGETVTDARTLARQIGLLRAMRKHDLHRVVSFHSRIDYASRFASSLRDTNEWLPARRRPRGNLWTDHVSGRMTAGERDVRLLRLKSVESDERAVLTNARCLNEGVDVPTLDGVAFIDPRRSQIDVVQAVGRAIRKAEDKALGTIVIPVFVDDATDTEHALESGEFDRVWQIVKALCDHDEVLAEEIDELRRELGRRGTIGRRPAKIVLDVPIEIGETFARAFDVRLVERVTAIWEEAVGAAQAFYAAKGHLNVPPRFVTANGFNLGMWITNRRQDRKRGRLSDARIAELDALGMVWEAHDEKWRRGLEAARSFQEANGHLRVRLGFATDGGFRLGAWISNARTLRKNGELSIERIASLDALGMAWEPHALSWQRGLAALRAFRTSHGHMRMSLEFVTADGLRLGAWLDHQRQAQRRGALTAERIAELDRLGMVWDALGWHWQRGLEAARSYRDANRDLRVPPGFVTDDGIRLGTWIGSRRQERKRGELSESQVAQLDGLGMIWDPSEEAWQRGLEAARSYRKANGHLRVSRDFVTADGIRLGTWLGSRRQQRRRGRLPAKRIKELDALGMVWEPHDENWQRGIEAARAYRDAKGHLRVPDKYVGADGFRLGSWISVRRRERKHGKLAKARVAELDALGMVWDAQKARLAAAV
jgi:superfamily II DNA or RNA helicase